MDFLELLYIPIDKQKHIFVSLCLFFWFYLFRKYYLKEKWLFRQLAFATRDVLIVWFLKEFIDLLWFWNPDFFDFFADSMWIILPFYFYFLYKESENIKINKFFRYEVKVLLKLENKMVILFNRLKLYLDIKIKTIIYKRKILYYIPNRTRKFLFKKSFYDFIHILEISLEFSIIWLINLVVMVIKIPVFAFKDAISIFIKLVNFSVKITVKSNIN